MYQMKQKWAGGCFDARLGKCSTLVRAEGNLAVFHQHCSTVQGMLNLAQFNRLRVLGCGQHLESIYHAWVSVLRSNAIQS
jgi:hypothetical protein